MAKVFLLSILMASIVIPGWSAADEEPHRALRNVIIQTALFFLGYAICLRFAYWRLL